MKLTWCGHSCFLLETAEGSAVFDPYAKGSVPGLALPALTADAVFCSHGHGDHSAAEEVRLTGKQPTFSVKQLDSFHDDKKGSLRGSNRITVIEAEGLRVAHLGDLGHALGERELKILSGVDVLLIPVGGFYTIDGRTAAEIAAATGARTVIPMHYRGEGFGYDVISTADEFLSCFENVRYIRESTLSLPAEPGIAVLSLQ